MLGARTVWCLCQRGCLLVPDLCIDYSTCLFLRQGKPRTLQACFPLAAALAEMHSILLCNSRSLPASSISALRTPSRPPSVEHSTPDPFQEAAEMNLLSAPLHCSDQKIHHAGPICHTSQHTPCDPTPVDSLPGHCKGLQEGCMHMLSLAPAHAARPAVLQDAVQRCAVRRDVRHQQQPSCPRAQRCQALDGTCKPQHGASTSSTLRVVESHHKGQC